MLENAWLVEQLAASGLVAQQALEAAQRASTDDLCRELVVSGAISEAELLKFLGIKFQTRYLSTEKLSEAKIPQWVLDLLPQDLCSDKLILPVRCDKQKTSLSVVTPDLSDASLMAKVKELTGIDDIKAYVAMPYAVAAGVRKFYRGDLHAFARMDLSVRQGYSELLDIYEQRLIDFDDGSGGQPSGAANSDAQGAAPLNERSIDLSSSSAQLPAAGDGAVAARGGGAPFPSPGGSSVSSPAGGYPMPTMPTPYAPTTPTPQPPVHLAKYPPQSPYGPPGPGVSPMGHSPVQGAMGLMPSADPSPLDGLPPWQATVGEILQVVITQSERDPAWRAGHSAEVARWANKIARQQGVGGEELYNVHLTALLHELGKPTTVHLTQLSLESNDQHRTYARQYYGEPVRLLARAHLPPSVQQALLGLYERQSGGGIPGQMHGVAYAAQVVAVADAYCDLLHNPTPAINVSRDRIAVVQTIRAAVVRGLFDDRVVGALEQVVHGTSYGQLGAPMPQMGRPMVLIIDEDPQAAALLQSRLSLAGYDALVTATTGDAALALLANNVRLVVSEVHVKPMDGFSFLGWLRSNEKTRSIPFIFLSVRGEAEAVERGFALGATDYIVKPFNPEVVVAKARRALQS